VPEVSSGAVEIVSVAREAGVRTKVAVHSTQDGVDPVGSCVGQRGVRVQKVIEELNNEKIDIVPYNEDPVLYLKAALAPAENLLIEIDEDNHRVVVTAPDDQLSLAIGRGGQNVRLAAKLTGYFITIQSAEGEIEGEATGEEGITEETREFLINYKLTTVKDLERFQDKWIQTDEIPYEQKEIIDQKVKDYQQELADRAQERAAEAAAEKTEDSEKSKQAGEEAAEDSEKEQDLAKQENSEEKIENAPIEKESKTE
jgi:N utilization substance protein A